MFCAMLAKNFVSWSTTIACYAKNEMWMPMKALELFQLMMLEDCDSVTMVAHFKLVQVLLQ